MPILSPVSALSLPGGVRVGGVGGVALGGGGDSIAPTAIIASTESSPTAVNPIPITVTFSEEVAGFVVGDLTIGNGTAGGDFATADNIVFTANIIPTVFGIVTIDINAAVCQDLAGNDNEAAIQLSILSFVGAAMWQKAGTESYQDTAGTILADDDGEAVGFENDQSANNNDATRIIDDTYRAVLKLNILSGQPVLRFTPNQAYSFPNTIISATGYYWFVAAKLSDNAASYPILSENDGIRRGVLYATATNFEVRHYTGAAYVAGSQQKTVDTDVHVLTLEHTGSAVNLYVDGVQGTGTGTAIIDSTTQKRLGAGSGIGGVYLKGDVAEVICYIGSLTAANRQAVEAYLTAKFF